MFSATFHHVPVCGSTNDEAKTLAKAFAPHGTVVTADEQTAGRGRHGRTFFSPAGHGLYLSVILRPALPVCRLPLLTLVAGLSVLRTMCTVLLEHGGARFPPVLKWPNDVVVATPQGLRKLAGILTEASFSNGVCEFVIVGIGANLTEQSFPPGVPGASLGELCHGTAFSETPQTFANRLVPVLLQDFARLEQNGPAWVLSDFAAASPSCAPGQQLFVHTAERDVEGISLGLSDDGALVLRTPRGTLETIRAGEILHPGKTLPSQPMGLADE
ncbi:MAG TPA: biotin--[acetyl-CoA-carboxylase] ligase [Pseudomonadota bacterium]|nr:biotin--[acetyl-CoA-carboxylase] ligase [Pseudomonadota bacterium]